MGLNITPKFTIEDVRAALLDRANRIEAAAISRLQFVGEQFVTNARDNGAYHDRTGNLRSSVGYIILKDGEQINSNFQAFPQADPKAEGAGVGVEHGQQEAARIAEELKGKYPRGLILIGVAGMNYAAAVESGNRRASYEGGTYTAGGHGYDVITSSALIAKDALIKGFQELQSKIAQMK
ncbi:MAG TPA: hypothetical protein VGM31_14265 [Puia sp.]|jgi:hypothetical protein